jgi:dipeptidyl aminopeptidase/acylaminoacyl peptidase
MESSQFDVQQLLDLRVVGDAQVSPDGDRIAYTVAHNGAEKGQRSPESRIWLVQVEDSQQWQVTYGPGTDRSPRWSPDGQSFAFLSDREKRGTWQLYLLDDSPRESRKVTDLASGIGAYAWSPDATRIAVTSTDHVPESDNDVKLFDAERRFTRIYLVDPCSGESSPVEHGDLQIWEFCWSPDGNSIAAIVSDEPQTWAWYGARLVTIDVESGDVKTLYEPERQIARPSWSPDGSTIALISCRWSDPGMSGGDVLLVGVADQSVRNATEGEPRSHLMAYWIPENGGLLTIGWEHARAQICRVEPDGGSAPLWTSEHGINDFACSFSQCSGRVATVLSQFRTSPEVWTDTADLDTASLSLRRVTTHNDEVDLPGASLQWLTWRSTDGREIEGMYLSPDGDGHSGSRAMVVLIHGGPTGVATNSFPLGGASAWTPFLLQRGIAVFMPNYRGSNGYGVEFAEANAGDLGGLDLQDVFTGIDSCVSQGLADPERLGIGGWSYGGYITAWAITQTNRFKAAVAGASITNWYSFHGGTNIPGFDRQFIGTSPHELDGPYAWTSPLFACDHVSTPTLFLHGEQDPVCPVGQAYEMTRSLRRCGVEAECAVYPREGHGFAEREHRRDMIERAVNWFDKYLTRA